MTIHPVLELRVGPYQDNKGEHRRCEMHQDAFIFPRVMNVGDVGLTDHLASGIAACHAADAEDQMDPTIEQLWLSMLEAAYFDSVSGHPLPESHRVCCGGLPPAACRFRR